MDRLYHFHCPMRKLKRRKAHRDTLMKQNRPGFTAILESICWERRGGGGGHQGEVKLEKEGEGPGDELLWVPRTIYIKKIPQL